jgi:hypothetical protein
MIQTINLHDFRQAFHNMGRGEQFTYEGLGLIFDHFEQYEDDTGEPIELDVIAICCDISEMTYKEVAKYYEIGEGEDLNPEDIPQAVIDYLNDQTTIVGEFDDHILFFNF